MRGHAYCDNISLFAIMPAAVPVATAFATVRMACALSPHAEYPFAGIPDAHRYMEQGRKRGSVVITVL